MQENIVTTGAHDHFWVLLNNSVILDKIAVSVTVSDINKKLTEHLLLALKYPPKIVLFVKDKRPKSNLELSRDYS